MSPEKCNVFRLFDIEPFISHKFKWFSKPLLSFSGWFHLFWLSGRLPVRNIQGHLTGNFEENTEKQQQSVNKGSWSHFKHLIIRRLLGKNLFTPSKNGGRVPNQQGAPITCNLAYWEVSQQTYVQTLLASWGVVKGAKFRPSVGLSFSHQHFLSKDIFFPNLPDSKNWSKEQIFWRTNPLSGPEYKVLQAGLKNTDWKASPLSST